MFCPNCGNKNSASQKFCRSCGLGLEKVVNSLAEQLPGKLDENLLERGEKLEKMGMVLLSVFGVGLLGFILYGLVYKVMMAQGKVLAGLAMLAVLIMAVCGLLSVVLFAKANEVKEASTKRRMTEPEELTSSEVTRDLLPPSQPEPVFSVTDRTTELLFAEKKPGIKEG